jgi:hypothetical protein
MYQEEDYLVFDRLVRGSIHIDTVVFHPVQKFEPYRQQY